MNRRSLLLGALAVPFAGLVRLPASPAVKAYASGGPLSPRHPVPSWTYNARCPFVLHDSACGAKWGAIAHGPCDKTLETCRDVFDNAERFGGIR